MFDKVFQNTYSAMDPHLCAATCSYICSKNFDPKYLYAETFLKGCQMTKDGYRVINFTYEELIHAESEIIKTIGYSLSS